MELGAEEREMNGRGKQWSGGEKEEDSWRVYLIGDAKRFPVFHTSKKSLGDVIV